MPQSRSMMWPGGLSVELLNGPSPLSSLLSGAVGLSSLPGSLLLLCGPPLSILGTIFCLSAFALAPAVHTAASTVFQKLTPSHVTPCLT